MFQQQNPEIVKLKKENIKLRKLLKKRKINYEYVLKTKEIKPIPNTFTITEEEEIKIRTKENNELKRLCNKYNIENNQNSKKNNERATAKEKLKKQMSF